MVRGPGGDGVLLCGSGTGVCGPREDRDWGGRTGFTGRVCRFGVDFYPAEYGLKKQDKREYCGYPAVFCAYCFFSVIIFCSFHMFPSYGTTVTKKFLLPV